MPAPRRFRLADSLGRLKTLSSGPEAYALLTAPPMGGMSAGHPPVPLLLLGLGQNPEDALTALLYADVPHAMPSQPVYWVECPAFEQHLAEAGAAPAIPPGWKRLTPDEAVVFVAHRRPLTIFYRQAEALFPEFWGPLLARVRLAARNAGGEAVCAHSVIGQPCVLLPGAAHDLLHLELEEALAAEGWEALPLPGEDADLIDRVKRRRPDFCLSVNLRGLDPAGRTFHLLTAMGVPVALWFVDNPWHILSALRLPWWRDAALFVTDASFVPDLRRHGARKVYHLPLAASSLFSRALDADPSLKRSLPGGAKVLFVGRSAFPRKDAFFAASVPPPALLAEANQRMTAPTGHAAEPPHFHWWTERLGVNTLWPGADVRQAGAGAEWCSARYRAAWLNMAVPSGLVLVGDDGWRRLLPASPHPILLPPVDYYTGLPPLYRAAPFTLNVTSLLLPDGLTQRHFDVWTAGGFLLSADRRGMDIFPADLAEAVTCGPDQPVGERVAYYAQRPSQRRELIQEWKKTLEESHTYRHRLRFLAGALNQTLDGAESAL